MFVEVLYVLLSNQY